MKPNTVDLAILRTEFNEAKNMLADAFNELNKVLADRGTFAEIRVANEALEVAQGRFSLIEEKLRDAGAIEI